jgi:hypothetical protein
LLEISLQGKHKYLIESTDAKIPFFHNLIDDPGLYVKWKKIIKSLSKNINRFRHTLSKGLSGPDLQENNGDLIDFLKTLNPLLLMDIMGIDRLISDFDPMQRLKFDDYVKYVDDLRSFIVPTPNPIPEPSDHSDPMIWIDFRKKPSMLFNYNGSEYYGSRELVFGSIHCLKEIMDIANFDQPITLSGQIPEYAMNLWIRSMYTQQFDLMDIMLDDMVQFLTHVDQYPTNFLTICSLEYDLIKYLDALDPVDVSEELIQNLKHISLRCKLKRLYLWIHNKQEELR